MKGTILREEGPFLRSNFPLLSTDVDLKVLSTYVDLKILSNVNSVMFLSPFVFRIKELHSL